MLNIELAKQAVASARSRIKESSTALSTPESAFNRAVLYRYRAGCAWRDLPERFGDFRVIHTRHTRWSKTGVWAHVFSLLAEDADNEYAMIDSTIVRAHQQGAGAQKKQVTSKPLDEAKVD